MNNSPCRERIKGNFYPIGHLHERITRENYDQWEERSIPLKLPLGMVPSSSRLMLRARRLDERFCRG